MSKKLNLADMTPEKGIAVEAMQPKDSTPTVAAQTEVPTTNEKYAPIVRTDYK